MILLGIFAGVILAHLFPMKTIPNIPGWVSFGNFITALVLGMAVLLSALALIEQVGR